MNAIEYRIGNAHHGKVHTSQGGILHDWEVLVDITKGDVDLIRKVVFKISGGNAAVKHDAACPTKSGSNWRYQIRKQTQGPVKVAVTLVGYKDAVITRKVNVVLSRGMRWSPRPYKFRAHAKPQNIRANAIPECNFGIELELSTSSHLSADNVARILSSATHLGVKDLTQNFAQGKRRTDIWRLVHDGSLTCPRGGECSKFELVSPILKGGRGLSEVDKVLKALNTISSVEVGKSMGFHCHIDVSGLSCSELVKVCQNFIKYEKAMDSFMPQSRRKDVQFYCRSNEKAIIHVDPHQALANCNTHRELATVMNPGNEPASARFYKLNLQNLVTGRQPTLEFRQHSGSFNLHKIKNWVRFCIAFVHNSAKFDAPLPLKKAVDDDKLFEMLMVHVINDKYLREFYRMRRNQLHKDGADEKKGSCCDGCASRGQCAAKFLPA